MNNKPELTRPFTSKSNHPKNSNYGREQLSSRTQYQSVYFSKDPPSQNPDELTPEDIEKLKKEKKALLDERSLLKAKIAHFGRFSQKSSAPQRNKQIVQSLEKQIQFLEQMTTQKREEINQILQSDRAAIIRELQEESKVLQLELFRLQNSKNEAEQHFREISLQLEEANRKYSSNAIVRQNRTIKLLERDLQEQKEKNQNLKERLKQLKEQREEEERKSLNPKLQKQIEEMKSKIEEEKTKISQLDKEIADIKEKHSQDLQALQEQNP